MELLQIYRKDVKFENLIYALLLFIYDYTETRPRYEDEEFAYELDNAILLLSWEIKETELSKIQKKELGRMVRWTKSEIKDFIYAPVIIDNCNNLLKLIKNK